MNDYQKEQFQKKVKHEIDNLDCWLEESRNYNTTDRIEFNNKIDCCYAMLSIIFGFNENYYDIFKLKQEQFTATLIQDRLLNIVRTINTTEEKLGYSFKDIEDFILLMRDRMSKFYHQES